MTLSLVLSCLGLVGSLGALWFAKRAFDLGFRAGFRKGRLSGEARSGIDAADLMLARYLLAHPGKRPSQTSVLEVIRWASKALLLALLLCGCSLEVSSARPHFGDCTRKFGIDPDGDWSCGGDPYLSGCVATGQQFTCPSVVHYDCDGYRATADVETMTLTIESADACVNVHRIEQLDTER